MNTPEKDDPSLPRQSEADTVPVRLDRCPSSVYYSDGWNKCMDYIAHALKLARRMPESPDRDELDYTILQIAPSLTTPQPAQADTTAGAHGVEWRWLDEKGRAMTNWKLGEPPPMSEVSDGKGTMRVEVRDAMIQAASAPGGEEN
jgi:hypothetical protein